MEIKNYLQILVRKWGIVIPVFLVTVVATIVFTFTQDPVYESTTTLIVRPNSLWVDVKSFASGLDMLSRRTEIAATYAEVATSRLIKQQAIEELDLSSQQRKKLQVDSQLRSGTNVLEITVRANDPIVARDFANTISANTIVYVQELYESFDLSPLDQASLPGAPIKPNRLLNLSLGTALGLALAWGLAFLSEYLQQPAAHVASFDIVDAETGTYNARYLRQRLGQEMSRAKRNNYPLSLASMDIDRFGAIKTSPPRVRAEALRRVTSLLRRSLRDEDVIARVDDSVFVFLLPDLSASEAKESVESLQSRIAWTPFDLEESGITLNLVGTAGIVSYNHNGTSQDEFLAEAAQALQHARANNHDNVYLASDPQSEENALDNPEKVR